MGTINRIRAQITGVSASTAYLNFYTLAGGDTAQDSTDLFAAALDALDGTIRSPGRIQFDSTVTIIESTTGQPVDVVPVSAPAATTCSGTGDALPRQTQMLVNLRTATYANGRQIQGHFNVPGLTETSSSSGVGPIIAGGVSTFEGMLQDIADSEAVSWCVYSKTTGLVPQIVSSTVNPVWSTLRGRLR
uniref:Uncharacterized protein n=1 Tax=uncultured prokaryote TaxID=198431 RepID=A0A0H5Q7M5_9ZZZZ|nr:hypothetical protein [uncultured prokaryote]